MAKALGANRSSKDVLEMLLAAEGEGGRTVQPPPIVIQRNGKEAASIALDGKGRATVSFAATVVGPDQLKALSELVDAFIANTTKATK